MKRRPIQKIIIYFETAHRKDVITHEHSGGSNL